MKGQSSTFKKKTIIEIIAVAILVVIAIASIVIFLKDRISSEAIDKDNQTEQIDNNQKADDNSHKNNGQQPDGTNQENNQNSGNNANNNNEDSNNNSNNSNGNNTNNTNNNTGVTNGSNVNEIGETTVERVEEREKLVSRDYWDWWKPTTISVNSTVANIVPALLDITVTKTAETDAGNKLVYAGEKITYTIVVKNNGNQDVEKIEVMDKIPSNTTFDSVENEGIVVKSSKYPEKVVGIKWIITVKAGEEASLKFTVVVDSGVTGTITNKAIANGEESNEENTSIITSNKTSEILRYNKETNKFEAVNVAKIDDEITYTILVTNTGDENGTTKIVDTVPEGTVLKRGSAEGAEISEDHKTVTWNDVEVPAGETVERTFTVIVKDIKSLENKKITNIATVGEKETNETENSTAEINVEKTVIDILRNDESIGLDAEVKEGDVIRYKITVTNTGSEDLTNVIVDEKLKGIELNEKELNIGNLKAGENKEIFASYTVSYEKDIKENVGKIVHNEVKVTGETIPTDPDKEPEKVEDKDEIDTPVADAPSVDISKVATRVKENGSEEFVPVTEKTKVRPGDVIEYIITVTNTGNVTLENIKVTDSLKVTVNGEVKDVDENGTSIIAEIKELSAEAGKNVETITTYYTVVESDVVEEKTIMNTATVIIPDVPGKDSTEEVPVNPDTSVSGTKIWKDNNNEYKTRPTSIVINLLQNGEQIDSKKVVATDEWAYTFDKLPKYDVDGKEYTYTITENEVAGYVTEISGNDVINTVTGITEVSGTKTWKDNKDEYKTRPESITINLLQNGKQINSKEIGESSDWAYEFKNLPEYDKDGVKYNYTVTEEEVTEYVTEISGYDVINTLTGTTSVNAIKIWQDNNNAYGTRPESIIINLLQNGKQIDSKEIGKSSDWAYEFKNLPEYDENGVKYNYSLTEENVAGYVTEISGYDVINTLTGKTEVSGTKTWVDGGKTHNNSKEITLVLTRKSEKVESVEETVEATVVWNGNTYTFSDLDKYDAEGYLYIYKVTENKVNDYTTEQDGNNFTNTMSEINDKIEVSGTKIWVDGGKLHDNAKEIILVLTRASAKSGSVEETVEATPTWDGNTYTFSNLAKYDTEGYLYTYKVVEDAIDGYTTVQDGRNFINTISDINEKINVIGTKTWIDGGREHDNTTEITLVLTRTSTKPGSVEEIVEVTPTWNGSTYTFSYLAKYDAEGYLYEYKVAENPVDRYITKVNGYNFTNTMSEINDTIDISGTKIWEDNENAYGTRPTSITVNLLQNGTKVASKRVTSADNWRYSFTDMPKYDAEGYPYTYTVTENAVSNYDTSVNGYNITNRLKLSLNKKATDKNGNIITELIYDSKSEASRKFNYVLTVTGQGQQKVTDVLPSGIVIEDNWSANNVTVTTDTTTGRQKITWNVNLTDDAADELIIPVIATEKIFEGKETESETVKSVLNLNFHNAGSTGKGNKDENSKKVNIFLRALGNADPSTDDGYIYAGQTTIATRYINEIKYASGQAKFVSGYDDAKVNSILSTKNTTQIEKMLTDFSKDNESSTGLGKYISGGLPSVATIRQNIKTLYSDKIELTDTQIILWYKVPYSVDEEVARNYVITDKENGNKKLVDKTINLPNCGYHIDGLIVDIKDLGGYIPEGTKVSVKNVANLGKMASEATVDIIYEKKLSESKVSSQELVSDDIEVNVEENIKQSEEPISKVEEKKVVNEETTKTDITTPSNTTKNVVSNTEQVVEKKDDEKVTASKESKFTVETSED